MGDPGAAERGQVAHGVPGPAAVVAVDVDRGPGVGGAAVAPAGPAAEDGGDARALDQAGQRVVEVQREDQRAVDVSPGEVAGHACVVVAALGEQQHQLVVVRGELLADAAQLEREEGVGEDPGLRLGDDHGDRVVAARDQAAGGLVGDVPQFLHGPPYPLHQGFAHPVAAVDDPRHGRP